MSEMIRLIAAVVLMVTGIGCYVVAIGSWSVNGKWALRNTNWLRRLVPIGGICNAIAFLLCLSILVD